MSVLRPGMLSISHNSQHRSGELGLADIPLSTDAGIPLRAVFAAPLDPNQVLIGDLPMSGF